MEEVIRLALFCAFAALFVGVVQSQLRRLRRIQRRYSDPLRVARLLADEEGAAPPRPRDDAGTGD